MDEADRQLLDALRQDLPLTVEPWRELARRLGRSEEEVLRGVERLRTAGVIRRIGGVFDSARLGYRGTLLALAVAPGAADRAGEILAGHPGVSHCYLRDDEKYHLWATLAVSPHSAAGRDAVVAAMVRRTGATAYLNLPALRRFKLSAPLAPLRGSETESEIVSPSVEASVCGALRDEHRRAVRALQNDLAAVCRPFDAPAEAEGFASSEELLVWAAELRTLGLLRRLGAMVHSHAVGIGGNVLVAWCVSPGREAAAGWTAARNPAVSHVYLRESAPAWPYRLYTMIHGPSREEAARVVRALAAELGSPDRRELWTVREYKKTAVKLFTSDEADWEKRYLTSGDTS